MEILIIIAVIIFGGLVVGALVNQSDEPEPTVYLQDPPTDRQLNFIDALIVERAVEPWMIERDPVTKEEASELIDDLLELPYRDGDDLANK